MPDQFFQLTLLDDTIITSQNKSTETAKSLDYIPGRMILGAVAARLYTKLSKEQQFEVFHSGQVQFGDARPRLNNEPFLYPTPLSLHYPKGARRTQQDNQTLTPDVVNINLHPDPQKYDKQLRTGFVSASGKYYQPKHSGSMRVALENGTAREGYLFGFDAVSQGTQFTFRLRYNNISDELVTKIKEALGKQIRIGRSKTAEYGRVAVEAIEGIDISQHLDNTHQSSQIPLLFLSDTTIRNQFGLPTLNMNDFITYINQKTDLKFTLVPKKTFVRSRTYSPFHGHRCRPDFERQVWTAGSVVTLQAPNDVDIQQVLGTLHGVLGNAIGDYTEEGLGVVLVAPIILQKVQLVDTVQREDVSSRIELQNPTIDWLRQQEALHMESLEILKLAKEWADTFEKLYGLQFKKRISKNQWGQIRAYAEGQSDGSKLRQILVGSDVAKEDDGFVFTGTRKLKSMWGYTKALGGQTIGQTLHKVLYDFEINCTSKGIRSHQLSKVVLAFSKEMQRRLAVKQ